MTRVQRRTHLLVWILLGLGLPLFVVVAVTLRPAETTLDDKGVGRATRGDRP
ncbi:MAG: hypothetical protein JNM07_04025 [Phycisphaerae bacterium]|nr:hypothetical protein [Phycisphaerae bacterium]